MRRVPRDPAAPLPGTRVALLIAEVQPAIMILKTTGRRGPGDDGFSLLEVLVAMTIVATALVSVAQLLLVAIGANQLARRTTTATALARQRIEQLRSLAWYVDATGARVTDVTSNLTVSPESPAGGLGLLRSSPTTLTESTPGYVDYLDANGTWTGSGATVPAGAAYIRRWSVVPLADHPDDTLVLQVLVAQPASGSAPTSTGPPRQPGDILVVSLKSRKAG
ncbi:MAG: type II secretion system protein [Planctomycetes bacterium]|nr:type II secretion system protein [Planctomycetota bacterium]